MTKLRAGEYEYKSYTIRKVEYVACGASPAETVWCIYEDADDMSPLETRNTKRDCKELIDNMENK